jgi:hypothetical protein
MENTEIITLQRTRDFSRKMNATFEFIKQNFVPLGKSLLTISGPAVLLTALLMGSLMDAFFSMISGATANPEVFQQYVLSVSFWLQVILMFLLLFIVTTVTISTINNYIVLYDEKKTSRIDVNEVWSRVKGSFWMYIGTVLGFWLVMIGLYLAAILVAFFLQLISPFLVFFGILGLYVGVIYFLIASSMTFFIRSYEKKGFFAALARSVKLIQGNFWATFGFAFVIYFIMSSIAGLAFLPGYIIMIVQILHNAENMAAAGGFPAGVQWTVIIFFTLYYVVTILLYVLPNVAIAFQYFNLVEEKESRGLISQIEDIGKAPDSVVSDEQY